MVSAKPRACVWEILRPVDKSANGLPQQSFRSRYGYSFAWSVRAPAVREGRRESGNPAERPRQAPLAACSLDPGTGALEDPASVPRNPERVSQRLLRVVQLSVRSCRLVPRQKRLQW